MSNTTNWAESETARFRRNRQSRIHEETERESIPISLNTSTTADDEISHQNFLNAYLVANGAEAVDMEPFRTLPGSAATGSSGKLRLTNLMQLTVDTVGGRAIGAARTIRTSIQRVRAGGPGSTQRSVHGDSENDADLRGGNTFRRSPTRRHSTSRPWSRAAEVCAWPWRRRPQGRSASPPDQHGPIELMHFQTSSERRPAPRSPTRRMV
jgi:hypothetical protein